MNCGENKFCAATSQKLVQFGKQVSRLHQGQAIEAITCESCGYVGFPIPNEQVLYDYYSTQYGADTDDWYNLEADYAKEKVNPRAENAIDHLQKYGMGKDAVIMEVGCAFGGSVQELRNRGYVAYGSDLNSDAIAKGRQRGNKHIFDQSADIVLQSENRKVNFLYALHALEHIPDPVAYLSSLKPCLADEAVLEFRIPSGAYLRAWLEGFEDWVWFMYPAHLHLFTPRSLVCLTESAGYELLSVKSTVCCEPLERITSLFNLNLETDQDKLSAFYNAFLGPNFQFEELQFEICAKDSVFARKFATQIAASKTRCMENQSLEIAIKEAVRVAKPKVGVADGSA